MGSDEKLIRKLRETRDRFEEEGVLHTFLMDAYSGGGGFRNGQVPTPPVTYWGRASSERGWIQNYRSTFDPRSDGRGGPARQGDSYIMAFPGEEEYGYRDRVNSATYVNPIAPIVRVTNSFLMESDAQRDNMPDPMAEWIKTVNSARQHIRVLQKNVLFRCQLVGWCAAVADLPAGEMLPNLAESRAAGRAPYLTVFWPQEILDWDVGQDGELLAVKLSTRHELRRSSMLDRKRYAQRITVWYPDHWEWWLIEDAPAGGGQRSTILESKKGPNPFGRVPVAFCRWDEPINGPVWTGMPQILTISQIARKAFNQQSELDYMMRCQVFGQLVGPQRRDGVVKGQEKVGLGNFLEEPWEAKGCWRYIAPSADSADTYEKALERMKRDVYRIALIDPGEGRAAETAESRRLRFQQTEAMLVTAATNLDEFEKELYRILGPVLRVTRERVEEIVVRRKRTYAVQLLQEMLDAVDKALDLPVGPLVKTALVQRTVRTLLPDAAESDLLEMDKETEGVIRKAASAQPTPAQPASVQPASAGLDTRPPEATPTPMAQVNEKGASP